MNGQVATEENAETALDDIGRCGNAEGEDGTDKKEEERERESWEEGLCCGFGGDRGHSGREEDEREVDITGDLTAEMKGQTDAEEDSE